MHPAAAAEATAVAESTTSMLWPPLRPLTLSLMAALLVPPLIGDAAQLQCVSWRWLDEQGGWVRWSRQLGRCQWKPKLVHANCRRHSKTAELFL